MLKYTEVQVYTEGTCNYQDTVVVRIHVYASFLKVFNQAFSLLSNNLFLICNCNVMCTALAYVVLELATVVACNSEIGRAHV
jgi:hypothetical protein